MPENLEEILINACGLVKDRPVIVGVSGGTDSLCLLEILRKAGYPVVVAHFDHGLRPESSLDARLVQELAAKLNLDFVVDGADVRSYAGENKMSIEEAARSLRYRFLFDLARQRRAQAVAVGHTADDQVETVLMHFLRGSGLSGLKGMSHRSVINSFDPEIPVVRPLLDLWREHTVEYCRLNDLSPLHDASNDSLDFQRNRIRHALIPSLESYNPKLREAILRTSQSLQADHAMLKELVEHAWARAVISVDQDIVTFDSDLLSKCAPGLQRNLVKHAMQILRADVDVSFSVLERAVNSINAGAHGTPVDLRGGLSMLREAELIYVYKLAAKLPFDQWPQMPEGDFLAVPRAGQVSLAGGWTLNCESRACAAADLEQVERNQDRFQIWLDAENLPQSFEVRTYRAGDRFLPLGMGGHTQKLADLFINEKIPQRARAGWPLLCAGEEILWVPGHQPSHSHRLTKATRNIIYVSISRPAQKISAKEPRQ